jgi:hypothetical protein
MMKLFLFVLSSLLTIEGFVGDSRSTTTIVYASPQVKYLSFDDIGVFQNHNGKFFYRKGNVITDDNGRLYLFVDKNNIVLNRLVDNGTGAPMELVYFNSIKRFKDNNGNFYNIIYRKGEYIITHDDGTRFILRDYNNNIISI